MRADLRRPWSGLACLVLLVCSCKKAYSTAAPDEAVSEAQPLEPEPPPEPEPEPIDGVPGPVELEDPVMGNRPAQTEAVEARNGRRRPKAYCETIARVTYCSEGGRGSIVRTPSGEVRCGPGPCEYNDEDSTYSCAPSRWASIQLLPQDDHYSCYEDSERKQCIAPSKEGCKPPRSQRR